MRALSTRQLTTFRNQVADILPTTCVIQTNAGTVDDTGAYESVWAAVSGGTVACRVDRLGQAQLMSQVDVMREQTEIRYQLTVPYDAPLAANCRVVTGGKTYDILQLDVDHSWNVSKKAIAVERR